MKAVSAENKVFGSLHGVETVSYTHLEILQLPASEAAVLQSIMDDLSAVGFDLSDLGGGSYAINGIPSVSYTHLDVYKRQLRDNARDGLTVQKMQQKLVGEIKVTPAEVRRYFKDLPQDSIPYIPVSYTHLDVYKRQPSGSDSRLFEQRCRTLRSFESDGRRTQVLEET